MKETLINYRRMMLEKELEYMCKILRREGHTEEEVKEFRLMREKQLAEMTDEMVWAEMTRTQMFI